MYVEGLFDSLDFAPGLISSAACPVFQVIVIPSSTYMGRYEEARRQCSNVRLT